MENLYIKEISDTIRKNFNIDKIILFGSHQKGQANEESDIDLLIILNENGIAKNYDERLERKLEVSKCLLEFRKNIPIDLLVFTKDEWKIILSHNTSFYNEINNEGMRI
ncbi:MAG: nucleotidyltransferase domain-containing protein [Ignavibacteriae bacterium]|nr:nucleotidyltransferase domain-containing protein [Ignavibacteriota bacterium]